MPNDMIDQDYDSCEPGLDSPPRKIVVGDLSVAWVWVSPPGISVGVKAPDVKDYEGSSTVSEPGISVTKYRNVGKSDEFKPTALPDGWLEELLRKDSGVGDRDFLNCWTDGSNKVLPIKIGDLTIGEVTGNLEDGNYSMRIWNQHFLEKIAQEPQEAPPNANDRSLHWSRAKHRVVRPSFVKDTFHLTPRQIMPLSGFEEYHNLRFKDGEFVSHRTNLLNALAVVTMDGIPNTRIEHKGHIYELKDHVLYVDGKEYKLPQRTKGLIFYVKAIVLDDDFVDCFVDCKGENDGNV